MVKQLLLMDAEYCQKIHVAVFFQKKKCFITLYQMMNNELFANIYNIFNLSTY